MFAEARRPRLNAPPTDRQETPAIVAFPVATHGVTRTWRASPESRCRPVSQPVVTPKGAMGGRAR